MVTEQILIVVRIAPLPLRFVPTAPRKAHGRQSDMAKITVSQSVDPNTMVLDIHEEHRTRISLLLTRSQIEELCDQCRAILGEAPTVPLPGPKLAIFPPAILSEMKVQLP